MEIKPILFRTDMVRAIFDGCKTQTRRLKSPGTIGDVLWVRETWNRGYIDSSDQELCNEHWFEEYHKRDGCFLDGISGYFYRAGMDKRDERELHMVWRPSIHMPKEAARLFLHITDVGYEPLQDMTPADCVRDGGFAREAVDLLGVEALFKPLWNGTIKREKLKESGWDANPWVWKIDFRLCERPEGFL